jgi:hypothetical protein
MSSSRHSQKSLSTGLTMRANPLNSFEWRVYRRGYTWFRLDGPPSLERHYAISSGVDVEAEHENSRTYRPLKVEPGLFRVFANTVANREGILAFANQYGLLQDDVGSEELQIAGEPLISCRMELLRDWMKAVLFMRMMVDLWDSIQSHDKGKIRKHIKWFTEGCAVFESSHHAASLLLPRLEEGPCSVELDANHSSIRVRGWAAHPDRYDRELIEYLQSEWIETALVFLMDVVNKELYDHQIGSPMLVYSGYERLGWQHSAQNLVGALWLQFADAIATNRNFQQCFGCKKWFAAAYDLARSDKQYCSQTCRTRAYRTRRNEARRLHALGSTLEELAKRLGSDPATIRGWLAS